MPVIASCDLNHPQNLLCDFGLVGSVGFGFVLFKMQRKSFKKLYQNKEVFSMIDAVGNIGSFIIILLQTII